MVISELEKRLIDKIQKTVDENLLEEAFRFLQMESEDIEVYKLSEDQKNAANEARQQIKNGQFLTDDEANKDINEWLRKQSGPKVPSEMFEKRIVNLRAKIMSYEKR